MHSFSLKHTCTHAWMHTHTPVPSGCYFPSNPCFTGVEMTSQVYPTADQVALGCLGCLADPQESRAIVHLRVRQISLIRQKKS